MVGKFNIAPARGGICRGGGGAVGAGGGDEQNRAVDLRRT